MRLNLLLSLALASPMVFAAKVSSLKVDGSIVTFTESSAKTAAVPACAAANPTKWGLSLTTDADRATYSVLVAAMASNMEVLVESAQKCVNGTGFEQVKSIEVLPAPLAALGAQGLRIVAVGFYNTNVGGSVRYTLTAANGNPFMRVKQGGALPQLECGESSIQFVTTQSSASHYWLCLVN
jgi:hypothetical protein